jgi:DNA-binding GntR family transcriptional regulator
MKQRSQPSNYEKIAFDIASRIVSGDLLVGSKISGRTKMSSEYNVSSETIRKALKLLEIAYVVRIHPHSGVIIEDSQYAMNYLNQRKAFMSVETLKDELHDLLQAKKALDTKIELIMGELMMAMDRFGFSDPLHRSDFVVSSKHSFANKNIKSLALYQKTQATIIAIKRGQELFTSPGPDAILMPQDKVMVIIPKERMHDLNDFLQASLVLDKEQ